jgi:hypothetical protein
VRAERLLAAFPVQLRRELAPLLPRRGGHANPPTVALSDSRFGPVTAATMCRICEVSCSRPGTESLRASRVELQNDHANILHDRPADLGHAERCVGAFEESNRNLRVRCRAIDR